MFFVLDGFETEAEFDRFYKAFDYLQTERFNYFSKDLKIVDNNLDEIDNPKKILAKELFGATYTGLIDFMEETYHELFDQLVRKVIHDASFCKQVIKDLCTLRYNKQIPEYIIRIAFDYALTNEE